MKRSRILAVVALVLASGGAFAFRTAAPAENNLAPNRFQNIANCPGVTCGASGSTSCNGFFKNQNCSQPLTDDLLYTP